MVAVVSFYLKDREILLQGIQQLHDADRSCYTTGCIFVLQLACLNVELKLYSVTKSFGRFVELPDVPLSDFIFTQHKVDFGVLHSRVETSVGTLDSFDQSSESASDDETSDLDDEAVLSSFTPPATATVTPSPSFPLLGRTFANKPFSLLPRPHLPMTNIPSFLSRDTLNSEPRTTMAATPPLLHSNSSTEAPSFSFNMTTMTSTPSTSSSHTGPSLTSIPSSSFLVMDSSTPVPTSSLEFELEDSSSDEDEEAIQAEMKRRCLRFEREEFLKATHSDDADDDLDKSILQKVSSCQPRVPAKMSYLSWSKERLKKAEQLSKVDQARSTVLELGAHLSP